MRKNCFYAMIGNNLLPNKLATLKKMIIANTLVF